MSATIAYRPDIDGLRTIAVGSVVAYHAYPALVPGGFVGVDIFFVISGFLITGILVREHERTGRIDLAEFYARRVRRLLPALLAVVMTTLALGLWLVPATGELQSLAKSALAALFFTSNIFFALQPSGYFAAAAETYPLLHTWTLAVEEQFYIVWPLLIPATGWIARKLGLAPRRTLWGLFILMFVGSLAISIVGTIIRPSLAFYLTPFRGWEFAIGAMLSLALRGDNPRWHHGATALSLIGLALIGISLWAFDHGTPFPGWIALLPTLGAAALLAAGAIAPANPIARLLARRPAVYIGKLSYGWYLWHWPLLALVRGDALGEPGNGALIAAVIASFLLSSASYHLIETPVRHQHPPIFRTTGKSLVAGIALLLIGAASAGATLALANTRLAASPRLQAVAVVGDNGTVPGMAVACTNYFAVFKELAPPQSCMVGDRTATRVVILIGDSHAAHYLPMLDRWGKASHVAVLQRSRAGCRPLDGSAGYVGVAPSSAAFADCARFLDAVLDEAAQLARKGHIIAFVVASRWPDGDVPLTMRAASGDVRAGFDSGLHRIATAARAARVRLVLIKDTPLFPHNVPRCLARRSNQDCSVYRAVADREHDEGDRRLDALAAGLPDIRVVNPRSILCADKTCSPIRDGIVLFADENHLSARGSAGLATQLRPALDAAILGR